MENKCEYLITVSKLHERGNKAQIRCGKEADAYKVQGKLTTCRMYLCLAHRVQMVQQNEYKIIPENKNVL